MSHRIFIECDYCGKILEADSTEAGSVIECSCGIDHAVPYLDKNRPCPVCLGDIDIVATKCQHCGAEFGCYEGYGKQKKRRKPKKEKPGCGCLVCLFFVAGCVIPLWPISLPICWGVAAILYYISNED